VKITEQESAALLRLASGDSIAFSQDGNEAWFTSDGVFLGDEVISLRDKKLTRRVVLDEENYRGLSERDVISDKGLEALK